jgi:hypothetical protein
MKISTTAERIPCMENTANTYNARTYTESLSNCREVYTIQGKFCNCGEFHNIC